MQVVKRMSYHSPGGQSSRQPQQTRQALTTQYRAPPQQVQQPQGQQFPPRQGRWSSLLAVSSVARRATLLRSVPRTGLFSLPSCPPTLADQEDGYQEESPSEPFGTGELHGG
jgi:hypothetical protein